MSKVLRLSRLDFDILENNLSAALKSTEVGLFQDDETLTAHGKIALYFHELPAQKFVFAWTGDVYPQWQIDTVETH